MRVASDLHKQAVSRVGRASWAPRIEAQVWPFRDCFATFRRDTCAQDSAPPTGPVRLPVGGAVPVPGGGKPVRGPSVLPVPLAGPRKRQPSGLVLVVLVAY